MDQSFTAAQLKIFTEKLSMSMKNYISQGQSHGFCKTSQVLKGSNYFHSTFYTNSKSFIAAESIPVQTRESRKQLAQLYTPKKG